MHLQWTWCVNCVMTCHLPRSIHINDIVFSRSVRKTESVKKFCKTLICIEMIMIGRLHCIIGLLASIMVAYVDNHLTKLHNNKTIYGKTNMPLEMLWLLYVNVYFAHVNIIDILNTFNHGAGNHDEQSVMWSVLTDFGLFNRLDQKSTLKWSSFCLKSLFSAVQVCFLRVKPKYFLCQNSIFVE